MCLALLVTKERLRLIVLKLLILNFLGDVITNIPRVICIVNLRGNVDFAGNARRIISSFYSRGCVMFVIEIFRRILSSTLRVSSLAM
jgi:hypothetical protein